MKSSRHVSAYTVKEREPEPGDILLLAIESSYGNSWRLAEVLYTERTKTHRWSEVREGRTYHCSRSAPSKTGKLSVHVKMEGSDELITPRFSRYVLLTDGNSLWLSSKKP